MHFILINLIIIVQMYFINNVVVQVIMIILFKARIYVLMKIMSHIIQKKIIINTIKKNAQVNIYTI